MFFFAKLSLALQSFFTVENHERAAWQVTTTTIRLAKLNWTVSGWKPPVWLRPLKAEIT